MNVIHIAVIRNRYGLKASGRELKESAAERGQCDPTEYSLIECVCVVIFSRLYGKGKNLKVCKKMYVAHGPHAR